MVFLTTSLQPYIKWPLTTLRTAHGHMRVHNRLICGLCPTGILPSTSTLREWTFHVCGHVRLTGNRGQGLGFYYSGKRNKHRLETTWTASDFNDQLLLTPENEGPGDWGNLKSTSWPVKFYFIVFSNCLPSSHYSMEVTKSCGIPSIYFGQSAHTLFYNYLFTWLFLLH